MVASLGIVRGDAVALIHGGLYESMHAATFWAETGVVDALSDRGVDVLTPERLPEPRSWGQDADHVAEQLRNQVDRAVPIVAGSNGCSTAARLALAHPGSVERLALCWPVTANRGHAVERSLAERISQRSGDRAVSALLAGETLRGVLDVELASLTVPAAVMASDPENAAHRRVTAVALRRLWADAVELPAMSEPPMAGFEPGRFADAIGQWLAMGEVST